MRVEITGNPTPEELAAVVAVLASRGGEVEEAAPPTRSLWNDRRAMLRHPLPHGPGAWRTAR